MDTLLISAKRCVEAIPEPAGRLLSLVPFSWRLGPAYFRNRRRLRRVESACSEDKRFFVFSRVRRIVQYATSNNGFYRDFYARRGFSPDSLRDYADLQRIPLVTKADLKQFELSARSSPSSGRLRVNTGGTSGEPLEFYLNRTAFAKEWAHMHFIWSRLGYRQTHQKLTFRGKDLGSRPLRYNAVHNEYLVNAYADPCCVAEAVRRLIGRREIRFIHGYPSTIHEFVRYCETHAPDVTERLRRMLKGVLLGSEFPAPIYRRTISDNLRAPSVSWYGHSEMAVLAYETEPYLYAPLHSYGYCEAVKIADDEYRLVGTSYDNTASPFIRYDTGDSVVPVDDADLLRGFRVKSGRIGDIILDARGHPIGLTALVFGRHHRVFSYASFLQVCQTRPGEATILVTVPPDTDASAACIAKDFDQRNVAVRFTFKLIHEPVRTPMGKTPLLVPFETDPGGNEKRRVA